MTLCQISCAQHIVIENIAGNGTASYDGVLGLALEKGFNGPGDFVEDAEGNIFFSVASGESGIYGMDALTNELSYYFETSQGAQGLAIDDVGNIYISRTEVASMIDDSRYIFRLGIDGMLDTISGLGSVDLPPADGAISKTFPVGSPAGMRLDPTGQYLYYFDWSSTANTLHRIDLWDILNLTYLVAGIVGSDGMDVNLDGLSALSTPIFFGLGLGFDSEGNTYFNTRDFQIQMIDSGGIIRNVAGLLNVQDYDPDNSVAEITPIHSINAFTIDENDMIYLFDTEIV